MRTWDQPLLVGLVLKCTKPYVRKLEVPLLTPGGEVAVVSGDSNDILNQLRLVCFFLNKPIGSMGLVYVSTY